MTHYLLDTNHSSLLFREDPALSARFAAAPPAALYSLCDPSVGELWYMVYNSDRATQNVPALRDFLENFTQLPFTPEAAEDFGRIKTALRKRGRLIPDVDIQIAAIARTQDLTVLTADAHFRQVPGLRCENWL
jgi:tRNA(fMet)-specific endonuclease VapC